VSKSIDSTQSDGVADTGHSRRTVVKGLAWSVPVIVVATAVPAAAASVGQVTLNSASTCFFDPEGPDDTDYRWTLHFTNNSGSASTVNVTALGGLTLKGTTSGSIPNGGGNLVVVTNTGPGTSSVSITYTVDGVSKTTSISRTYSGQCPG
jgi:hypothetical protein